VLLVRDDRTGRRVGRIVETEAYGGPEDRASHARFRSSTRNAVMFGPAGHAYVYRVYGMHDCLNVVTGPDGEASAVLIRAVEALTGLDIVRAERHRVVPDARLASGPGLVGAYFGVDPGWTGLDLCDGASPLRLEDDPDRRGARMSIDARPRVGIDYAGPGWVDRPWRFSISAHPAVSRAR
jgi:DNA-3-methyladenine glycosylase